MVIGCVMDFHGCFESEAFSGAIVEFALDVSKGRRGDQFEIGSFGEVLAKQAVHIFVGATFPGTIGIGEVAWYVQTC